MSRWERFYRGLITLKRIFKTGCINFVRNAWLSVAAIAIMLITLTIILFSLIANATFSHTIQDLTDKIDVSVYLKDSVTTSQKDGLIQQLQGLENVKTVDYSDKDQALLDFQQSNSGNDNLIKAITQVGSNPIPATIHIKPRDPNRIQDIKDFLDKPEIKTLQAKESSYSGERKLAVDNITKATSFMQRAGVAGVILFALISMMIIFNTIQMAIFNRRDELTIMRLLGASTTYIRGPFVVESMLYGIISAVVSVSVLNALFAVSSSTLQASSLGLLDIQYSYTYFSQNFWRFLTILLVVGIFIGTASSLIATRRYLKFKPVK